MTKDEFIVYSFNKPMLELQQSIISQICQELNVTNIKEYFTGQNIPKEIQNEILNPNGLKIMTAIDHSKLTNTPIFQLQQPLIITQTTETKNQNQILSIMTKLAKDQWKHVNKH